MDLPPLDSVPPCSRGHTATYDLDTKRIYVFGGMKEGKPYSTIYILDTATWKWLLVAVSSGPSAGKRQSMVGGRSVFLLGDQLGTQEQRAHVLALVLALWPQAHCQALCVGSHFMVSGRDVVRVIDGSLQKGKGEVGCSGF